LLVVAACGAPAKPRRIAAPLPESPAGVPRDVIVREVEAELALAARACACTNVACLDAVEAELIASARTEVRKSYVTELDPRPSDLAALGGAAWRRIDACQQDFGFTSTVWMTTDVLDATDVRDAACSCTDIGCTRHMKEVVEHYREIQIKLAPPGTPERRDWDLANIEADACIDKAIAVQALVDWVRIRDAACLCEDATCAQGVISTVQQWGNEYAGLQLTTEVTDEKMHDIAAQIRDCLQAAAGP
jgi:hypothetical protein